MCREHRESTFMRLSRYTSKRRPQTVISSGPQRRNGLNYERPISVYKIRGCGCDVKTRVLSSIIIIRVPKTTQFSVDEFHRRITTAARQISFSNLIKAAFSRRCVMLETIKLCFCNKTVPPSDQTQQNYTTIIVMSVSKTDYKQILNCCCQYCCYYYYYYQRRREKNK